MKQPHRTQKDKPHDTVVTCRKQQIANRRRPAKPIIIVVYYFVLRLAISNLNIATQLTMSVPPQLIRVKRKATEEAPVSYLRRSPSSLHKFAVNTR